MIVGQLPVVQFVLQRNPPTPLATDMRGKMPFHEGRNQPNNLTDEVSPVAGTPSMTTASGYAEIIYPRLISFAISAPRNFQSKRPQR